MSERARTTWDTAIARARAAPDQPRLVYQPIVDLQRGSVTGYEALSRFDGPPDATPDVWFAAAAAAGHGIPLELAVVKRALAARPALPPNTFLSVNVSPGALLAGELHKSAIDLRRTVFELTEHEKVTDYPALRKAIARIRQAGGLIAVDDAGAGYASLRHLLELRPQFVKLDRELIRDIGDDPAKRAAVRMLGDLASRTDAWIIAEGVETQDELDALLLLRVPLAQGYFLGRPTPSWGAVEPMALRFLGNVGRQHKRDAQVSSLIEARPCLAHDAVDRDTHLLFRDHPELDVVIVVDAHQRPIGVRRRLRHSTDADGSAVLVVAASADVAEVGRRATVREPRYRSDPLACCDQQGRYIGVVTIARLLEWFAR
ncbi:MAG: EAL domain-containing protein [Deltaproteobacteria bacterium]|nr:EAL domain-containing protein [Nannocystaceae bacterium]